MPVRNRAIGIGLGLLGGMLAGATIGMLYAPRRGEETRKIVKDKATEIGKKANDIASKTGERTDAVVQQITNSKQATGTGESVDATPVIEELPVPSSPDIPAEEIGHPRSRADQRAMDKVSRRIASRPKVAPQISRGEGAGNNVVDTSGKRVGTLEVPCSILRVDRLYTASLLWRKTVLKTIYALFRGLPLKKEATNLSLRLTLKK